MRLLELAIRANVEANAVFLARRIMARPLPLLPKRADMVVYELWEAEAMTPDDKRRLAGFYMIRMTPGSEIEPAQWSQVMGCWLTCGSEERVSGNLVHEVVCSLDEAITERDVAMATLRPEAMTPDDKRRLAEIDEVLSSDPHILGAGAVQFLRRLLDEVTAEADHYADMFHKAEETIAFVTAERDAARAQYDHLAARVLEREEKHLAAHSAETKSDETGQES